MELNHSKQEAEKSLLDTLDVAVSAAVKKYPELDRLAIYNTLQLLSWRIIENQPSLASSAMRNK